MKRVRFEAASSTFGPSKNHTTSGIANLRSSRLRDYGE